MREIAEFRVDEEYASILFGDGEGKKLGDSVRKIEIETTDPRFAEVGRLQREFRRIYGKPFFYGWSLKRRPTQKELKESAICLLRVSAIFEPTGEECGTVYDESTACGHCGAEGRQLGPLFLEVSRICKGRSFAATIAGETVVSRQVVELFHQHRLTGVAFGPVIVAGGAPTKTSEWFHMNVQSAKADIVAPTRVGIDPFDDDPSGEYRCPFDHTIGLNLLSAMSIASATLGDADFVCTRQFIGVRRGLLRPERQIVVSARVAQLIRSENLKGCDLEVAHLV